MNQVWKYLSVVFWITYGCLVFLKIVVSLFSLERSPLPIKSYVVQTASMEPSIRPGDMIFVANKNPEDLRVRDIITFQDSRGYVITHRITQTILENEAWEFITKGDNNNAEDKEIVSAQNIIGIHIGSIPKLGYILVATGKPTGVFLMVAIPLLLVFFEDRTKKQTMKSEFQLT